MDKHTFRESVDKIDIPEADVLQAIKIGVNRAKTTQILPTAKKRKRIVASLTIAASLLLTSSFIIPSFSHALADTPFIGDFYTSFNQLIGRNLENQKLVTNLNQTATDQDIGVKINGAYYDGNVIGFNFQVKGNVQKSNLDDRYYAMYELFGGNPSIDDSIEITELSKTKNGFTGNIQFYNFSKELLKNMDIPLSFTKIGEKDGHWNFHVPIQQIEPTKYLLKDVKGKNETENISLDVTSIVYGKATTVINYQVSYPTNHNIKVYRLELSEQNGREIHMLSDGVVQKMENNSIMTVDRRIVIPQVLNEHYSNILVKPEVARKNGKNIDFNPVLIEIKK